MSDHARFTRWLILTGVLTFEVIVAMGEVMT